MRGIILYGLVSAGIFRETIRTMLSAMIRKELWRQVGVAVERGIGCMWMILSLLL